MGLIPGLDLWVKDLALPQVVQVASSCAGRRGSLDPALLWLWSRPTAAALIQPLAWELPYATDVALKRKKKKIELSEDMFFQFTKSSECLTPGLHPELHSRGAAGWQQQGLMFYSM